MIGWIVGVILAAALAVGGYLAGRSAVNAEHLKAEAEWQAKYDKQSDTTAATERKWVAAIGARNEWKAIADAAASDAARVADQLHAYRARRCPLPAAPAAPAGTGSPAPEPRDVEGIERRHLANCAADAADFAAIRELYNSMRAAQ